MIEILKKEDIKQYKYLIDESFGGSNDLKFYEKYQQNSNYIIFVMKKDSKIVGSLTAYKLDLFTFSFQPALEIFNVCVLKEYQNQNLGKRLFEEVFKYAKESGYNSVCLTCLDTAIAAHKLYESVGMTRASSVKYNIYF